MNTPPLNELIELAAGSDADEARERAARRKEIVRSPATCIQTIEGDRVVSRLTTEDK